MNQNIENNANYKQLLLRVGLAFARAQELRDPYTAGHGVNVAFISRCIAEKLGWDSDRIIGLELAGLLHDIGKIGTPSDILLKPTQLSQLEMTMVREHVQQGYDVLKDINFPFPLAEMVYQHHEKLDGSGYPRGLKGEQIIPEAMILAVADII